VEQVAAVQEKVRNKGWRIQRIPWKMDGKAEWVHNTPLSLGLALLGLAVFLAPIMLALKNAIPKPAALVAVAGIGLLLLSRVVAERSQFRGWIPVDAVCVDRETRKRKRKSQGSKKWRTRWQFRVLCQFEHNGQSWNATPDCHAEFRSETALNDYLTQTIDDDGKCRVFVDPENPLHAVFHELPVLISVSHFWNG